MSMKKLLVAVAVAGVFVSSTVGAQAPAASAAPSTFTMSAEQRSAVKEMLDAMNFKAQMQQMSAAMTQGMPQMMAQTTESALEQIPQEKRAEARSQMQSFMQKSMNEAMAMYSDPVVIRGMEDIMGRSFAKVFTVAEIRSITAFYKSDVGQKLLFRQPQILQESLPELMALLQPRMKALTDKMMVDAKAMAEKMAAKK
jgi:hypothetical protein